MPERKVRHALLQYPVTEGGNTRFETAFRGQIVNIPADQVERLDSLGATVEPESELARPGTMITLPDTATDAEITGWVLGATNEEVEALVKERPAMAGRIISAHASIQRRFEEQNLHLGGLRQIAEEAEADLIGRVNSDGTVNTAGPGQTPAPSPAAEEALTAEAADRVVAGKAPEVVEYISNNPTHAAAILEAEGRRSAAAKDEVRVTIVRAAEAAASFTPQ